MASPPDFGWKEGFSQLGSYRTPSGGLSFVYAKTGCRENAPAGTLWAWILAGGPYTNISMVEAYEPAAVNAFPVRAAVRAGSTCSFPSIEADALVAAGVAAYA